MVVVLSLILLPIPDSRNKVFLVGLGCFTAAVGAFLTGPSKLLGLPNSIKLTTAGMVSSGLATSLIQSYVFTYILKEAENAHKESKEEVKRKVPLITEIGFGLSSLVLPMTTSGVFDAYGFRIALDLVGILFTLNCLVFLLHLFRNREMKLGEE